MSNKYKWPKAGEISVFEKVKIQSSLKWLIKLKNFNPRRPNLRSCLENVIGLDKKTSRPKSA